MTAPGARAPLGLRLLPPLTLILILGPVAAGLWGAILPAAGHLPAAGIQGPSMAGIDGLLSWPGLFGASVLSVTTGFLSTILALGTVTLFVAGWSDTRVFTAVKRLLSPLLSVPHAAAAFGIAFLIAPSGWPFRLIALATGAERPPDLLIVGDSLGLSLTAGLVAKEVPFLLLMTLAALPQTRPAQSRLVYASLGYGRVTGWLKTVFPAVYAQIRLPVYVVLAYAMSVVDVAIVLGPTTPPSLSVQIVRWTADPDLSLRSVAAAGAIWQAILVAAALAAWYLGERLVARVGLLWAAGGSRRTGDGALRALGLAMGTVSASAVLMGLAALAVWSFAGLWRFPDLLPGDFTVRSWQRHAPSLADTAWETAVIAFAATLVAIILTIGCHEAEHRSGRPLSRAGLWLVYVPLIVPQIVFLPGLQTFLLRIGADGGRWPVIMAHIVFVLPYVFLAVSDPWRAWDGRYGTVSRALGASPWRTLFAVRLPMLTAPILTATAIGLAVSVGQFLPTLLIGGGRVATLTTEAVALSSGGDRRAIAVFALAQTAAALLPFALAIGLPILLFRNRRGLHG